MNAHEMKAAIADLQIENPDLREAMADLIRHGRLVDSGERRDGRICWVLAEGKAAPTYPGDLTLN